LVDIDYIGLVALATTKRRWPIKLKETNTFLLTYTMGGTRWSSWLGHCATNRKGFVSRWGHWLNHSGHTTTPGLDSAPNRNEYQGYTLGRKGGRYV